MVITELIRLRVTRSVYLLYTILYDHYFLTIASMSKVSTESKPKSDPEE